MGTLFAGIALAALGAGAALGWWLRRRSRPEPPEPGRLCTIRERSSAAETRDPSAPDHVEHELDFRESRYRRTEVYLNEDPWAESDTSRATEDFLVRRTGPGAWEIRLVARNGSTLDAPGEWEKGPQQLSDAWERGWQVWSRRQAGPGVG